MSFIKKLSAETKERLITILKKRFTENSHRHPGLSWSKIEEKLDENPDKLWSLNQMEETGGEPDVFSYDKQDNTLIFYDFSKESPQGRRSVCYDRAALEARKKYKPENDALNLAKEIGIELLSEKEYRDLQKLGEFDTKTSSWIKTPEDIRKLGGAIFGDFRYGKVFIYHNGAESYYASRGFRGFLKL